VRTAAPYDVSYSELFDRLRSVAARKGEVTVPRQKRTPELDAFLSGYFYYEAEASSDDLGVGWTSLPRTVEDAYLGLKEIPGEIL